MSRVDAALDFRWGHIEGAKTSLKSLQSLVDKMATKGIIHKNTASRYKSRLAAKISK